MEQLSPEDRAAGWTECAIDEIKSISRNGLSYSGRSGEGPLRRAEGSSMTKGKLMASGRYGLGPIYFIKDFGDTAALMLTGKRAASWHRRDDVAWLRFACDCEDVGAGCRAVERLCWPIRLAWIPRYLNSPRCCACPGWVARLGKNTDSQGFGLYRAGSRHYPFRTRSAQRTAAFCGGEHTQRPGSS